MEGFPSLISPPQKILALPLSVKRCWAPGKANYWENDKNSHKKSIMPVSDKIFFFHVLLRVFLEFSDLEHIHL